MRYLVLIIGIAAVAIGCKKEKTSWDTEWSAPLINDTLSLKNLVNDSTLIESGGFYALDLNREIFNLNLTELINIPDTTIIEQFTFGTDLNIFPGLSFINSVEEHELELEEIQLKEIYLNNGFIDIKVTNPLPTAAIFNVQLPGVSKNGVTFNNTYTAPPGTQANPGLVNKSIDLSGYKMDLTGISGGDFNMIKSQITVSSDPNGPDVLVTPADIMNFEATFRDVNVFYARGYFGSRIIQDTTDVLIDALAGIAEGSIDIPNTALEFQVENGIKVSAAGTILSFLNENGSGATVNLISPYVGSAFNISPATGSWNTLTPSVKSLYFNSGNSNIENYIGNLGAKHLLAYKFQINPWGNTSGGYDELFPNSRLKVNLKATMPLAIGVNDLLIRDTFDLTLNQDPERTRITSGELVLNASNGFPIGGTVKLHLLDESGAVLHTVTASQPLKSAQFGSFNSTYNFNVANSELKFYLSEEGFSKINDVKRVVVEARFATENPVTSLNEPMQIPVDAFLAVKLKAKLTTEMKF